MFFQNAAIQEGPGRFQEGNQEAKNGHRHTFQKHRNPVRSRKVPGRKPGSKNITAKNIAVQEGSRKDPGRIPGREICTSSLRGCLFLLCFCCCVLVAVTPLPHMVSWSTFRATMILLGGICSEMPAQDRLFGPLRAVSAEGAASILGGRREGKDGVGDHPSVFLQCLTPGGACRRRW